MTTTLQPATPPEHHRFHLLDALRGIAAMLIVCYHVPRFIYPGNRDNLFFAVDFFFCLSGFALAFSYQDRLQTILTVKDFFAARVIRLYPTHVLGLLLGIAEAWFFFPAARPTGSHGAQFGLLIVLQFLMLPNLGVWPLNLAFPLNYPAWSLLYEMLASVGFALLVRRWRGSLRTVFFSLFPLAILWIYRAAHGGTLNVGGGTALKVVPEAMVRTALSFSLGVAALFLFRRISHPLRGPIAAALSAVGICASLVFILVAPFEILRTTSFQLAAVFLLFPALVCAGALVRVPAEWNRGCAFLGNISYPLYLLHVPILVPLLLIPRFGRMANQHPGVAKLLLPLGLMAASAFAHLAFKFYETPMRKLLSQLYNSRLMAAPRRRAPLNNNEQHSYNNVFTEL